MKALRVEKRIDAAGTALSKLLPLLNCPACSQTAPVPHPKGEGLRCSHCQTEFPVYSSGRMSLPWLFPYPENALVDWNARFNSFLQQNLSEQFRLNTALETGRNGVLARKRLTSLCQAKEAQRAQVLSLLEPLGLDSIENSEAACALYGALPKIQGLSSYYSNIFRDWAWENGENEQQLESVERVLEHTARAQIGKVLTLGAGSCRLPYDLHRRHDAELSVAVDINPLLLLLASRVMHGESIPMYEFPIAPLDQTSFAVRQVCSAPAPIGQSRGSFHLLFADALNPPFRSGAFDTVLTPWLIDIIPQDFREFIPTLNRVLKKGGIWVNTGSLAFFHKDAAWCYSEEEVLELLEAGGFEILTSERRKVRYLQSPHSAHGRIENVLTFSARKTKTVGPRHHYEHLPQWILDIDQPIPEHFEFSVASSNHLLSAQVLAAINGERTTDEIGQLVAKQYGLEHDEAENAVRRILTELYEAG